MLIDDAAAKRREVRPPPDVEIVRKASLETLAWPQV